MVSILNSKMKKNIKPKYIKMPVKSYVNETLADTRKSQNILDFRARISLNKAYRTALR